MDAPTHPLLIGIGNPLRGDDGAGYRLAATLLAEPDPSATPWQVLAVQQLTPDLAPAIANARLVLFVDADLRTDRRPQQPRLEPIPSARRPRRWPDRFSHQCHPAQLLELSGALYGQGPAAAWSLLLPARQLRHGEDLSPITARALAAGLQLVRQWRQEDA